MKTYVLNRDWTMFSKGELFKKANDGCALYTLMSNETKTHTGYIYTVAIESSDDVSLTTKIRIKYGIDRLGALIDALEQVQKKKSK